MKYLIRLLGMVFMALVLLMNLGISSASAHPFVAFQRTTVSVPSLAPNEASIEQVDGHVIHLAWGRPTLIHHVVTICTGVQTKARFRLSTGTHFIDPNTCQSFDDESGYVQALANS